MSYPSDAIFREEVTGTFDDYALGRLASDEAMDLISMIVSSYRMLDDDDKSVFLEKMFENNA